MQCWREAELGVVHEFELGDDIGQHALGAGEFHFTVDAGAAYARVVDLCTGGGKSVALIRIDHDEGRRRVDRRDREQKRGRPQQHDDYGRRDDADLPAQEPKHGAHVYMPFAAPHGTIDLVEGSCLLQKEKGNPGLENRMIAPPFAITVIGSLAGLR